MGPPLFATTAWVRLGPHLRPTGKLDFVAPPRGGPQAEALLLLTAKGDRRCYLYYCQADGTSINDSLHNSLEEAMAVAELGFNVRPADWQWSPWPGKEVWSVLVWTAEEGPVESYEPGEDN